MQSDAPPSSGPSAPSGVAAASVSSVGPDEYGYGTTPKSFQSGSYLDPEGKAKDAIGASAGTVGEDAEAAGAGGKILPKILLMGLRRSGKSSIQKVVFHKMSPNETLFLETTNQIVKEDVVNSSFVQFSIWDFPGQIDFFDAQIESENIFDQCGAIIFVIDSQDDLTEALNKLNQTVLKAFTVKSDIKIEVFIHKVDGLSDDTKMESQREICSRSQEDLQENGLDGKVQLSYYLTSIYDHSIFEAFSKVVQKLIKELPYMEQMLDTFVSRSQIDKAFLFDVISKIYVATDSSPVDMQSYELCCDMIDVVIDVSSIYGLSDDPNFELAFDDQSASVIELANGSVLYLYEVCKVLALVCIIRKENYDAAKGLIAYNFSAIKSGLQKIFEHRRRKEESNGVAAFSAERASETTINGAGPSSLKNAGKD